ncbi:hypothetical protein CYR55_05295 [Chimaeribacter californicus]|uniref:Peptidase S74 domain-containing protein n=1 Tax=Chimaeribacter californicus TaxID=2060067 RepID=A0A2N5EDW0_9GAMM|nr:pyocin knob domain-containing S74 family peptidase [Chimaeribacter californicus]PLR40696.1 hypothetical protein CYR55_05295 [Chimaeribacter californicus]
MAWYTTGTIAVSGTTVTGTGTNWTDNKQGIGPGQALLIPGAGTVKMYEIKSVDSATKLTLMSNAGTLAAGQAYAIMSFYTDSVPDFARRLAAQLSYYQSQMDGWQQLLTSTDSVTLVAPDGTSVSMSSIAKLTADMAGKVSKTAALGVTDPNTITSTGWYQVLNTAANVPLAVYAEMQHVEVSSTVAVQIWHATTANRVFTRTRTAANTWGAWAESYSTASKPLLDELSVTNAGDFRTKIGLGLSAAPTFTALELSGATPYIDFHYGSSTADYTARFIQDTAYRVSCTQQIGATKGLACKPGLNGAYSGTGFNAEWNTNNELYFWVDASPIGKFVGATSDKRLKKDISYEIDINQDLDDVLKFRPATFKFAARGIMSESGPQRGFIAQDVQEIYPVAVQGGIVEGEEDAAPEDVTRMLNLDAIALISKLTGAVQAQQKQIDTLTARLDALSNS